MVLVEYFYNNDTNAKEYIELNVSDHFGRDLEITILFGLYHALDRKIHQYITVTIGFVSHAQVLWPRKHQHAISSSTYQSKFYSDCCDFEEAYSSCYIIFILRATFTQPTLLLGDYLSMIYNSSIPDSGLKKNM